VTDVVTTAEGNPGAAPPAPDALLVLSFGGPEGPEDVLPFLRRVLRGRNVPEERLLAVAEHYDHFGGVSPINAQNRALVQAVRERLAARDVDLPVYWGNRNWHPLLADTLATMRDAGVRHAAVFVTSAFGSYSGCRQYLEDLLEAAAATPGAPRLSKLPLFFDHPGFLRAVADGLATVLAEAGPDPLVFFSAHSIPEAMSAGAPYREQLGRAAAMVAGDCGLTSWELVFQSRSGPPSQPWLGPDVCDRIRQLPRGSTVVLCPIGFVSDHMEVLYDLDTEASAVAAAAGIRLLRSPTAGTHPAFVDMVVDLALAPLGAGCDKECCPPGHTPGAPALGAGANR